MFEQKNPKFPPKADYEFSKLFRSKSNYPHYNY